MNTIEEFEMDGYGEVGYWKKQAALWQHKYTDLQQTLYQQWARNQRQHEELMKKAANERMNESDYIQKLEDENTQLRVEQQAHESEYIQRLAYIQQAEKLNKYIHRLEDKHIQLRADLMREKDYIQKLEDENNQLRVELMRESE